MAYGFVNAPGVSIADLNAVKAIALQAQADAEAALDAAGEAQEIAGEVEGILASVFGGTLPSKTLADNSPETIKKTAQLGYGSAFWSVGDKIGIQLNGSVGSLNLNGTYYAYIIGFNHNSDIEGLGIDFMFAKSSVGIDLAFVDDYAFREGVQTSGFYMTATGSSAGGWRDCYMRTTICPAFLNAMPKAWRDIISECSKYSENGSSSHLVSEVTKTNDKIFLLAEFEMFGVRTYANNAEQNYQKQYEYFANGNRARKVRYDNFYACYYWLRSATADESFPFCTVDDQGNVGKCKTASSLGFAPAFKVA